VRRPGQSLIQRKLIRDKNICVRVLKLHGDLCDGVSISRHRIR
jgi:hypothetical protein